jgi:hypothetical protein
VQNLHLHIDMLLFRLSIENGGDSRNADTGNDFERIGLDIATQVEDDERK